MKLARNLFTALALTFATAGLVHCGGASDENDPNAAANDDLQADKKKDAGAKDSGSGDGAVSPTWSALYADYFAADTVGHCGNAGCHAAKNSGFKCGTSKSTCYSGLVSAGLISTAEPSSSKIINPATTPLAWFGGNGKMPKDEAVANPAAATALQAWVLAGAKND